MKLQKIEKIARGKFISLYHAIYKNKAGGIKVYEMVSRNHNLTEEALRVPKSNAVSMIAFNRDKTKILLNREFRMPVNKEIYNFPCGLIDEGEDAITAAKRELKEETGLDCVEILDTIGVSYSAIGFSDDTIETVVMIADGEFAPSTSYDEEIEANWYSKDEIKKMLKEEYFAARTQIYLYMWIQN